MFIIGVLLGLKSKKDDSADAFLNADIPKDEKFYV